MEEGNAIVLRRVVQENIDYCLRGINQSLSVIEENRAPQSNIMARIASA